MTPHPEAETRKLAEQAADKAINDCDHCADYDDGIICRDCVVLACQSATDAAQREAIRWAWKKFYTGDFLAVHTRMVDLDHDEALLLNEGRVG